MTTNCCVDGQPRRIATSKSLAICVPAIGLFVVPKCPLCLAAYIMLTTGVSISATQASWMRTALLGLFGVAFVMLLVVHFRRKRRCVTEFARD